MITIEQAKVIGEVLVTFNKSEIKTWGDLDECMVALGCLSDKELVGEVNPVLERHLSRNARCEVNHSPDECVVPMVLQACNFIVMDFETSKRLAKKARYVLEYYLSLTQTGVIISD